MKEDILPTTHSVSEISSGSNAMMKVWRSLLSGKGVKKHDMSLVFGSKIVGDVIESSPGLIRHCLISSRGEPALPAQLPRVPVYRLRHELFHEIDIFGTMSPILVVDVPGHKPLGELPVDSPVRLVVPFQDPANVGAVIRSAAAFGVRDIVILEESANPYHPKSIRASSGQVFRVTCYNGPSIRNLQSHDIPIVALDADAMPMDRFDFPERFFLLPGVEGPGLPDQLQSAIKISIPIASDVESLNANVAASIALYEWKRRFEHDG